MDNKIERKTITINDILILGLKKINCDSSSFATMIGVNKSTITRYLKKQRVPTLETTKKIVKVLSEINNIDILDLLNDDAYYYHGSKTFIDGIISTRKNKKKINGNDFGFGFYLGETFKQAVTFVSQSDDPTIYLFKKEKFSMQNAYLFSDSLNNIIDWLIFVALNRNKIDSNKYGRIIEIYRDKYSKFDTIVGKIADSVNFEIIDYFFDNKVDVEQVRSSFLVLALGDQIVIKNEEVANKLVYDMEIKIEKKLLSIIKAMNLEAHKKASDYATTEILTRTPNKDKIFDALLDKITNE